MTSATGNTPHRMFSFFIASSPYHVVAKSSSFITHPKHRVAETFVITSFHYNVVTKSFFMPFFIKQPSFKDHLVAKYFLLPIFMNQSVTPY
jgi:hypothetical protein